MSTPPPAASSRTDRPAATTKDAPAASAVAGLQLDGISKVLGGRTIVDHLDLDVAKGELVCLLGPSGCGKTTTLRMIGGFLQPDAGRLHIDGVDHTYSKPERRPTAMVFQNYALWPHMSVSKNIAFGLKVRKMSSVQIKEKIDWALDLLGLQHHKDSMPARISGGEQQRVALARALVLEPEVLLMDEPLSNLDAKLRVQVRETIKEIQQRLGITTVFVTHDQEEALSIADRVAVMSGGRIEQLAPPAELYRLPRTTFVAGFVGTMNIFDSGPDNGGIPLADGESLPCAAFSGERGDSCWVRPEDIQITDAGAAGTGRAVVLRVIPRGHYREVLLQSHGTQLRSFSDDDPLPEQVVGVRANSALVYAGNVLVEGGGPVAAQRESVVVGSGATPVAVGLGKDPSA
ncbi:MAG: ABC transporter ATP-binding protein [Actinomycetota bacterium]|nr:ABC transporter ATP-binding protein [Actinomycetota bacterium]